MPQPSALTPANLATLGDVDKMLNFLIQFNNVRPTAQPAKSTHQHKSSSAGGGAVSAVHKKPKPESNYDCLAADNKTQSTIQSVRRKRAGSENGSTVTTKTTFAGKDHSSHRYMGKGFVANIGCSPGPIYGAVSSLGGPSTSFSQAPRLQVDSVTREKANTPAPDKYDLPHMYGPKQVATKSSQAVSFSHRRNDTSSMAGDLVPGPGAFMQDIFYNDPTKTKCSFDIRFGNGGRAPNKLFISRQHIADAIGHDSPGPATYSLPTPAVESKHYSVTTTSIKAPMQRAVRAATSTDGADSASIISGEKTVRSLSEPPARMKVNTVSPGPASYTPSFNVIEKIEPSIGFPKSTSVSKKQFLGKAFMAMGLESPGPGYLPPLAPKPSGTVFADPDPNIGRMATRFTTTAYHGKGIGEIPGQASPGPGEYTPILPNEAPAATLMFKEGVTDRPVIAGPKRARFINKEISSKENFGVYSPGPKYMLPGTFGKVQGAPGSCTFGLTDRHFQDLPPEHVAKLGSPTKPYTTPAEVKYISAEHTRSHIGKISPGPGNIPNDEAHTTSKFKRAPAYSLYHEQTKSRKAGGGEKGVKFEDEASMDMSHASFDPRRTGGGASGDENSGGEAEEMHLLNPRLEYTKPNAHVFKFSGTNPRAGGAFHTPKETFPSAAEYKINLVSQTKHVSAGFLGPLGGPLSPPKIMSKQDKKKKKTDQGAKNASSSSAVMAQKGTPQKGNAKGSEASHSKK